MYKISINESSLMLRPTEDIPSGLVGDKKSLLLEYRGYPKLLLQVIDTLEKSPEKKTITIHYNQYHQLINDFNGLYKTKQAAGGVVFNDLGQILVIFRRGFWDLPKGKIDKGETRKIAAIREVQEETGLQKINLQDFLTTTYHTYKSRKGKRILKPTHWFNMKTQESLVRPQIEEDIEEVLWINPNVFLETKRPVFNTICEVIALSLSTYKKTESIF